MKKSHLCLCLTAFSLQVSAENDTWLDKTISIAEKGKTLFAAAPAPANASKESKEKELKHRLEIGPTYSYVTLQPHGFNSFHGNLGGVEGMYEYRAKNFFYGAAKLSWMEGKTRGHKGTRDLIYVDAHERVGYTFACEKKERRLTLFTGFGYRYMWENFDPKSGSSVKFKYNEFYVPVGLQADYGFGSWFILGAGFMWMPQVFPTVSIVPLGGTNWTVTRTFNNFYVDLDFDFILTKNKRFHLIFNPFYQHWQDGHSTAKTSTGSALGLPGNTYNFYGANLNLAYCF